MSGSAMILGASGGFMEHKYPNEKILDPASSVLLLSSSRTMIHWKRARSIVQGAIGREKKWLASESTSLFQFFQSISDSCIPDFGGNTE